MSVSASTLLDLCALLCDILAIVWLCGVTVDWGGSDKWYSVAFAALAVVLRLAAHTIHPWRSFTSAVLDALIRFGVLLTAALWVLLPKSSSEQGATANQIVALATGAVVLMCATFDRRALNIAIRQNEARIQDLSHILRV